MLKDPRRPTGGFDETAFARVPLAGELDGWTMEATFRLEGHVVLHGPITFTPDADVPFGALSAAALRRLGMAEVLGLIEDLLRQLNTNDNINAVGWIDALTAGRRPGSGGQDIGVYLTWAQRRVEAEGKDPSPIEWMVAQWGGLFSKPSINKYVHVARQKNLLSPALDENGKRQPARLTDEAERLLAMRGEG